VRGCILAHRQELVEQNAGKLQLSFDVSGIREKIGIFCAGLKRRDYYAKMTFASIDSVFRRSGEFPPFDFLFVDEAQHIPPSGEGKYRTFINGCKRFNPKLKVVGWTATPFRMGCGAICHKDHILTDICYEASITDLINQGYLCKLRSKVGEVEYDLKEINRPYKSDYTKKSLDEISSDHKTVKAAVREAVIILNREQRRSIIFFCISLDHCKLVSEELQRNGIYAPRVTSKTDSKTRLRCLSGLRDGQIRAICNVGVLTEGFDAPCIDAIVLLRPTLSAGLFAQMVGRGLRPNKNKTDCLVLDFANCIDEHGPIDLVGLGNQYVAMATCQECRESFSRAIRVCPACGWEIPKQEIERVEAVEKKRRLHGEKASKKSILSDIPETFRVDGIKINRHPKPGKPDRIRFQFRCGITTFRHWVFLDDEGIAGKISQDWWRKMLGTTGKTSVNEALQDLFLVQKFTESIKTVTVRRKGRYTEIVGWNQKVSDERIAQGRP
jgi:DNA repair protein RadD